MSCIHFTVHDHVSTELAFLSERMKSSASIRNAFADQFKCGFNCADLVNLSCHMTPGTDDLHIFIQVSDRLRDFLSTIGAWEFDRDI